MRLPPFHVFCSVLYLYSFIGAEIPLSPISVGNLRCSLYIFCTVTGNKELAFSGVSETAFLLFRYPRRGVRHSSVGGLSVSFDFGVFYPENAKKIRFGQKLPNLFRFCKKVCIFCAGCTTDLIAKKVLQTYILRLRPVFRRYFSTSCLTAVKSA